MSNSDQKAIFNPSVLALLVVNAIPFLGVLVFSWNALDVMMLFWVENIVVGFYNVIRMLKVEGVGAMIDIFFFVIYFGAFAFLHLLLILVIFGSFGVNAPAISKDSIVTAIGTVWVGILGFMVSHGVSYLSNFIGRKEYRKMNMEGLLKQPYGRTLIPHAAVLIGLIFVLAAKSNVVVLALFVVFKIWVDVHHHKQVHKLA
jgi:hypothetical protein